MEAYQVVCDSSDRERWLEERNNLVTASDVACLLGVNPYKSALELYLEKTGQREPFAGNETTEWGLLLEPVIIEEYERRTQRIAIRDGKLLRSNAYPFLGCTMDGRWRKQLQDAPWHPLEIKTTGAHRADDWDEGVPEYYLPQVQAQMIVTDTPMASVACLIGGQRMVWCDVERDDEMCVEIISAASDFMHAVETENPPPSSDPKALAELYGDDGRVVTLDQEAITLDGELADARELIDRGMKARDECNAQLLTMIGDAHKGVLPGDAKGGFVKAKSKAGKVYLRRVKR